MRKVPTQFVYDVLLTFVSKVGLYTSFEFHLGLFEQISDAEHIRRVIANCNPDYNVTLTCKQIPNPRLSTDFTLMNNNKVF